QTAGEVKSLMTSISKDGWLSAWWPMPFGRSATVSLYNGSSHRLSSARSALTAAPDRSVRHDLAAGRIGYFRATANSADTVANQDYRFLKAAGAGKFVGVAHSMQGPTSRAYLEGDERVYVDGAQTPQIHGTGTEDYYEGGWYFNRDTFTNPIVGEPSHQSGDDYCAADADCSSVYRLMLTDSVAFGSALDFGIEHGPVDDVQASYSSTAFWYGAARFTHKATDNVDVGNTASERAHAYRGGDRATLTATYEGDNGPQSPSSDDLRTSTGKVSFRVALDKRNEGATLRRTSDQDKPRQQAKVRVDGRPVGTWTQPLDNPAHRWLDDTFELPASVTAGHREVTVTLTPTDDSAPWTAARYTVLSSVAPFVDRTRPARVTGLTAIGGDTNAIDLAWTPAADDTAIDHYVVYGARGGNVVVDKAHRLGATRRAAFAHTDLGVQQRWTYRVVAVDVAGHRSAGSATATARTGNAIRIEAERQLPPVGSTAPAESQGNCCGISWSGGAQLWLRASAADQYVTIAFDVPTAGTYDISSVQTQAPDYAISTLKLDGAAIGKPVDGYKSDGVGLTPPADDGTH
ncbi:MAG: DUF2961 domain-containing protein, partial [Williamsia herbipolensis]|nr:DUF2961 domain-containing protein [Williamsia herbipolensis]